MTLRLIVMRHAKSAWPEPPIADHDRPLNARGRRDTPRMARHLANMGWRADQVISSTAQRTRETWSLMAPRWGDKVRVRFERDFYLADPITVLRHLAHLPQDSGTVMVLGHNNGWQDLVAWLSGHHVRMTTANAALLTSPRASWSQATTALDAAQHWTLEAVIRPKEI